jgi:hypothetical protein
MKNELEKLFTNTHEKVLLDYFDLNAWVESKLEGTRFTTVLQKVAI